MVIAFGIPAKLLRKIIRIYSMIEVLVTIAAGIMVLIYLEQGKAMAIESMVV